MPSKSPVKKVTINNNRRLKIPSDKDSAVIKYPGTGIKLLARRSWINCLSTLNPSFLYNEDINRLTDISRYREGCRED